MAVTKVLTKATPFEKNSKVEEWDLEMTYKNDSEGAATYYTSTFIIRVVAANGDFTAKAKADWTKNELEALCPISQWDTTFGQQVDSVITNPPNKPVPDSDYSIPS